MEELTAELFDGKVANVLKVSGYNDGYYWEYEILFDVNGYSYNLNAAGSGSGYIKDYREINKGLCKASKLSGVEKVNYDFDAIDALTIEEIVDEVQTSYEDFIKSGAKESYKYFESDDDYATFECHVDSKAVDPANRGWKRKWCVLSE